MIRRPAGDGEGEGEGQQSASHVAVASPAGPPALLLLPDPSSPPDPRRPPPLLVPAATSWRTRGVRVRGARSRSRSRSAQRDGGVRAAVLGRGDGSAGEAAPGRPHLRRALRREGHLPQLGALGARSHSGI